MTQQPFHHVSIHSTLPCVGRLSKVKGSEMAAKGAVSRQLSAARGPSRAQQQGRGGDKRCGGVQPVAAAGALEPSAKGMNMTASQRLQKFASTFTIFFPLWTVIAAGAALARPETYTFMSTDKFTGALAILYELLSAFLTHSLMRSDI
jgi:hypothetical protein